MNSGMMRWKVHPLYPNPCSMVHKARKFSVVLGTTSLLSSIIIRPASWPPIVMSKNTLGLGLHFVLHSLICCCCCLEDTVVKLLSEIALFIHSLVVNADLRTHLWGYPYRQRQQESKSRNPFCRWRWRVRVEVAVRLWCRREIIREVTSASLAIDWFEFCVTSSSCWPTDSTIVEPLLDLLVMVPTTLLGFAVGFAAAENKNFERGEQRTWCQMLASVTLLWPWPSSDDEKLWLKLSLLSLSA